VRWQTDKPIRSVQDDLISGVEPQRSLSYVCLTGADAVFTPAQQILAAARPFT
jgi:hypothetical protein